MGVIMLEHHALPLATLTLGISMLARARLRNACCSPGEHLPRPGHRGRMRQPPSPRVEMSAITQSIAPRLPLGFRRTP